MNELHGGHGHVGVGTANTPLGRRTEPPCRDRRTPFGDRSHRINLLVVGTVACDGVSGLIIGNTAEAVLDDVRCSVLTVKPRGFVSPIRLADT